MATLTRKFSANRVKIGDCVISNVQCEGTEYAEGELIEYSPGIVTYEVRGYCETIDFEWVDRSFPSELQAYFESGEQVAVSIFVGQDVFSLDGWVHSITLPQQEDVFCPTGKIDLSFSPKCQVTIAY